MPDDLDFYASRFAADRAATKEAIEDVWAKVAATRQHFGGLPSFSQYAVAQKRFLETEDGRARVALAEELMRQGGYVIDTPAKSGARRWKAST